MNKLIDSSLGTQTLKKQFDSNQWLSWTVRIILVIYAAFVATNLNQSMINVFDNSVFRLLVAVLIIYLCYVDQASAILLAVGFVISIQSLNKYKLNNISVSSEAVAVENETVEDMLPEGFEEESDPLSNAMKTNDKLSSSVDTTPMPSENTSETDHSRLSPNQMPNPANGSIIPQESFGNVGGAENEEEKPFETFQNPNEVMMKPNDPAFTSGKQFNDAQDNRIANNQMTQVQTWNNQQGPQGLNQPFGFNLTTSSLFGNNIAKF